MSGVETPTVSLILTVKNEETSLPAFFASVDAQTLPPNEVILVDGGSTDGTLEVARRWKTSLPFIIVSEPGVNIAAGRNLAMKRATSAILAVTDAGTRLSPTWLERLTEPFQRPVDLQPDVVAGFFEADAMTTFELALGVTTLPDVDEISGDRFLPSSRSVAVRRSLFEAGVRYPEWLDYCEDLIFDLKLKRAGARFEFSPAARVAFRPRSTANEHWSQYYRYARGDGKAGLFTGRHLARYATYFGLLPWALRRRNGVAAGLVGAGSFIYLRKPVRRLIRRRDAVSMSDFLRALAAIPLLRVVGDVAKMAGYPVGLWWRVRQFGLSRSWRSISDEPSGTDGDFLQ